MTALQNRLATASIASLAVLQIVMLTTLLAQVPPHPPAAFVLSGMAPFLAASLALLASAHILDPLANWAGRVLGGLAILFALVSFGPQKYFDIQWPLIWPAVLVAQAACTTLFLLILKAGWSAHASSPQKQEP